MIKRYLENTEANPEELKEMDFQNIIRKAYEKGLIIGEWKDWREYRKDRGATSHTYNEDIADQVFNNIPDFLQEAQALLAELEKRNDNN
jgi:nucleotidyltransferase substrate binding protein (TIGR01987 family)